MKKNVKKLSTDVRKDQADKTRSTKQMKPWEAEYHGEDLSNIVVNHLFKTCPKKVLNKLLGQIKEKWEQVIIDDHVSQQMYEAGIAQPYTADKCRDHALDFLVWRTVLELLNRHDIYEGFDLTTMYVEDADLLVLTEGKHAILGVAFLLKGDKASITIFPEIAPHFACEWSQGPFDLHMHKTKKTTKKKS